MTRDTSIVIVFGTRPEIIKLSPIIKLCKRRHIPHSVVHTGQHYSNNMVDIFFQQLDIPAPDYNLGVGSKPTGQQTGDMISRLHPIIDDGEYDTVLVQGDTNSTLAGSIAASKLDVTLGHVEAGLRSHNREMPEEINRELSDHAADYLFAPTKESRRRLLEEGISDDRIRVTGNTIVDAVNDHIGIAKKDSTVLDDLGVTDGQYAVLTAHREENVDNPDRFVNILGGVDLFAAARDVECIYPVHPRARKRICENDLNVPERIRLVDSLSYLDFLKLQNNAMIVFTDSGGVQEETCILNTPCVTVREETERPETLSANANRLAGSDPQKIVTAGIEMTNRRTDWSCPFGSGTAAEQIVETVVAEVEWTPI